MENMFTIPGYYGTFNASKISRLWWRKGRRVYHGWHDFDRNCERGISYRWSPGERWYEIKYLFYKLFNTRKPIVRIVQGGSYTKAYVVIYIDGKFNDFEFSCNDKARIFHDKLLGHLKIQKFTCQFKG